LEAAAAAAETAGVVETAVAGVDSAAAAAAIRESPTI
jgi:hypothetical protein